jgi:hypothetical protein
MYNRAAELARGLLHFSVMRSLLALFVVAALGFAIILKKDAPPQVAPIDRIDQFAQSPKKKSSKRKLEHKVAVTHVAVNEREQIAVR